MVLAKGILLSFVLIIGLVPGPRLAAQDTLRAAAVVNDEVISMLDLAMRTRLAILSASLEDSPEVRERLAPQILRTLIDERLQTQEATRLNIETSDTQVEEAFGLLARQNQMSPETFDRFLIERGVLPSVMRDQLRAAITWRSLINLRLRPEVIVGDEEVDAVVQRIESDAGGPEILASEIFLATDNVLEEEEALETGARLVQQLRNGANFTALARQFSQSATASVGGDLGWLPEGQLPEEVAEVVQQMQPGQLSRPILTLNGVYIIWLRDQRERDLADATADVVRLLAPMPRDAAVEAKQQVAQAMQKASRLIEGCEAYDRAIAELGSNATANRVTVRLAELPASLRRLVMELPYETPSQPVELPNGIGIIVVCDRSDGEIDRGRIVESLVDQRLSLLARRYLRNLRRAANIDLRT